MNDLHTEQCSFQSVNPSAMAHGPSYLPSEGIVKDTVMRDAVAVSSSDGEVLVLQERVCNFLFHLIINSYEQNLLFIRTLTFAVTVVIFSLPEHKCFEKYCHTSGGGVAFVH